MGYCIERLLFCDCCVSVCLSDSSSFWFQHRGRVRPRRGRRGHLQGVPRPPEEPEGAGGGGEDHTSQPGHKTRDVVRPDHQLVGPGLGETSGWGCSGPVLGLSFN